MCFCPMKLSLPNLVACLQGCCISITRTNSIIHTQCQWSIESFLSLMHTTANSFNIRRVFSTEQIHRFNSHIKAMHQSWICYNPTTNWLYRTACPDCKSTVSKPCNWVTSIRRDWTSHIEFGQWALGSHPYKSHRRMAIYGYTDVTFKMVP